jgi:hypothetical protein
MHDIFTDFIEFIKDMSGFLFVLSLFVWVAVGKCLDRRKLNRAAAQTYVVKRVVVMPSSRGLQYEDPARPGVVMIYVCRNEKGLGLETGSWFTLQNGIATPCSETLDVPLPHYRPAA